MSITNDPQLVQPQGTEKKTSGQRPKWVVAAVLYFVIFGVYGFFNGLNLITQIGNIDWVSTAHRMGTQVDTLRTAVTIEIIINFALTLSLLASSIGMWAMKKWGADVCLVVTLLNAAGLILAQIQGVLNLTKFIGCGLFVLIGIGQLILWRKGKLT